MRTVEKRRRRTVGPIQGPSGNRAEVAAG